MQQELRLLIEQKEQVYTTAEGEQKTSMNYYVYINGKEHHLIQGFTISEEYNETLDSATIMLSNSQQLDLNPYDDVFIYGEWCGYYDKNKKCIMPAEGVKFKFIGYPVDLLNYTTAQMPAFYKHFLIDQFTENIIVLDDDPDKIRYSYTIELFSETKGLETIQAPNISITQPLKNKKSTITYVNQFLSLYNKGIKKTLEPDNLNSWYKINKYSLGRTNQIAYVSYEEKQYYKENQVIFGNSFYIIKDFNGQLPNGATFFDYNVPLKKGEKTVFFSQDCINDFFTYEYIIKLDNYIYLDSNDNDNFLLETLSNVFGSSYCPDFTLNNPSLRQILDKLLITKNRITVVRDDKIYAMDITKRRGYFDLNQGKINYITGTKSSENYCTNLKRTYTDGLAQDSTGRYVEYLGFRNSDDPLLSLSNMRVETAFPIYKINKFYMCYFKKYKLIDITNNVTYENVFLCKQNITPLIKLNSERNVLSEDIREFNEENTDTIEKLAKYKLATLGYDIGSKYIEGWGTQYSYPNNFLWQNELKTYLENIFFYINSINPTGIYNDDYIIKKTLNIEDEDEIDINYSIEYSNRAEDIPIPSYTSYSEGFWDFLTNIFSGKGDQSNEALHMKHIFFEVDYTPFFSGTIIQSKGFEKKGNITINDNQSSSLSLLEIDGLAQKEKINRYGNKGIQINARYTSPEQIQGLGSVYEKNLDKDIVIFHKEYSLNCNSINCTYYGSKDYVLKDYFTSVYAKHRTYNLMSYGESIIRAENAHFFIFLSKNKRYYDPYFSDYSIFNNFGNSSFQKRFLSFFDSGSNTIKYIGQVENSNKINYGYFKKGNNFYASDSNIFVSGTSFCLNICMRDNVTVGNYISDMHNEYINSKKNNYMFGATQDFAWLTDEATGESGGTTGFLTTLGFYFGHVGSNKNFISEDVIYSQKNFPATDLYENKLFKLPIIEQLPQEITNVIGFTKDIYKDNKERIDMTIQFEPINDNEVYFSQWLTKLSDLFGVYPKFNRSIDYQFLANEKLKEYPSCSGYFMYSPISSVSIKQPVISIVIDTSEENWEQYLENTTGNNFINSKFVFVEDSKAHFSGPGVITSMNVILSNLISFDSTNKELQVGGVVSGETGGGTGNFSMNNTFTLINLEKIKWWSNSSSYGDEYRLNKQTIDGIRKAVLAEAGLQEDPKYLILTYVFPENLTIGQGNKKVFGVKPESGGTSGKVKAYNQNQDVIAKYEHKRQLLDFSVCSGVPFTKRYEKNLYWVYTPANYDFKEYMVYDELDNLDNFKPLKVVEPTDPPTLNSIQITWISNNDLKFIHPSLDYGSHILCYYKDENSGKFNFVFGFKPDKSTANQNKTKLYTDIYISVLSFDDLTLYNNTNLPIGKVPSDI